MTNLVVRERLGALARAADADPPSRPPAPQK
jgi:hypothetical protein